MSRAPSIVISRKDWVKRLVRTRDSPPDARGAVSMTAPLFCRASGFGSLFAMVEAEQGAEGLKFLRRQSDLRSRPMCRRSDAFRGDGPRVQSAAKMTVTASRLARRPEYQPAEFRAVCGRCAAWRNAGSIDHAQHRRPAAPQQRVGHEPARRWRGANGGAFAMGQSRTFIVEHHAERSSMHMLSAVGLDGGSREELIAIDAAEPDAAEERRLQSRSTSRPAAHGRL